MFFNIQASWFKSAVKQMLKILMILIPVISLVGCGRQQKLPYELSEKEYESLKSFFSSFLFSEGGAYTLFSDKPITFEVIVPLSELGDDDRPFIVNDEDWENGWKKVKNRMKTPLFLLIDRPSPLTKGRAIFLVNIAATAVTLQKHYRELKELVDFEFDPFQIIFEIEDEHSSFWDKVLKNEYFLGTILGYGEDNAHIAWLCECYEAGKYSGDNLDKIKEFIETIFNKSPSSNACARAKEDIAFLLPSFGCYAAGQSEKLLEKYKHDRERIKRTYKGKDPVKVTLDRLTSNDLSEDPDQRYKKLLMESIEFWNTPK